MEYYGQITKKVRAELHHHFESRLLEVNEDLDRARTLSDARTYLEQLRDKSMWNSISFCLRRFVYEHLGPGVRGQTPAPYTVTYLGQTFAFSAVLPGQLPPPAQPQRPPEEEVERYGQLLYLITMENGCYAVPKNFSRMGKSKGRERLRGAITKEEYMQFLRGQRQISRDKLFLLSLALGFDHKTMEDFMLALGEPPYNLRSAQEAIYYFCHSSRQFCSMETFLQLRQAYEAMDDRPPDSAPTPPGYTTLLRQRQDAIAALEDDQQRLQAFLDYLQQERSSFIGYSKTAQAALLRELQTTRLVDFDYDVVPEEASFDMAPWFDPQDLPLVSLDAMGQEVYHATVEGELAFAPGRGVRRRGLDLDSRLREKLMDGPRLRALLSQQQPGGQAPREHAVVGGKDILQLRLFKLSQTMDYSILDEGGKLDVMQEFCDSTNRVLLRAGLWPIYPPNPFDHAVLMSLCYEPLDFFSGIFLLAQNDAEKKG